MIGRALIVLSFLLAGCAHTAVSVNGGSVQRTSVVTSGAAAAIVIGTAVIGSTTDSGEPSFSEWFWQRPAPAMDPNRTVSEQDCTQPISGSGNLRCR